MSHMKGARMFLGVRTDGREQRAVGEERLTSKGSGEFEIGLYPWGHDEIQEDTWEFEIEITDQKQSIHMVKKSMETWAKESNFGQAECLRVVDSYCEGGGAGSQYPNVNGNRVWNPGVLLVEEDKSYSSVIAEKLWISELYIEVKRVDVRGLKRSLASQKVNSCDGVKIMGSAFVSFSLEDKTVLLPGRKLRLCGEKIMKKQYTYKNTPLLPSVFTYGTFLSPRPPELEKRKGEQLREVQGWLERALQAGGQETQRRVYKKRLRPRWVLAQVIGKLDKLSLAEACKGTYAWLSYTDAVVGDVWDITLPIEKCRFPQLFQDETGVNNKKKTETVKVVQVTGNSLLGSKKLTCGSEEHIEFEPEESSVLDKPTPTKYSTLMWLLQNVFKSDVKANLVIKRNTRDGEQELQEKMSSMITIIKLVYSQSTDMMECFDALRPPEQLVCVPFILLTGIRNQLTKRKFLTQRQ